MDDLKYICYNEGCSSLHRTSFFSSLKDMNFSDCENFRGWQKEADVNNVIGNEMHHSLPPFPCLSYIIIQDCPNLSSMPTFSLVERLVLKNCSTKPLLDIVKASISGSSATQDSCPSLSKLKYLGFQDMDVEALPEGWMRNLTSLKNLSIGGLSSLVSVFRHMQHLPAELEQVTFQGINNLDPWSVNEGFSTLCQALQCLRSLQTINILFSENPRTLTDWICDLRSLQFIVIHNCQNLQSLPDGLQRLVNLQSLQLNGDLLLLQKCERGRGSEWPKISHIPSIWINGYQI
ncbi:putative disease resistance protein RGA3 [Prosopis cineraria]|uniref:putative disease resistance protein RGA3 n=1 Tax=Prosopis cineraria TaxID=364024 RepID=UPI00240ECC68|nr:putative disease resistance protein RGA3 [Prosopis cineraria]